MAAQEEARIDEIELNMRDEKVSLDDYTYYIFKMGNLYDYDKNYGTKSISVNWINVDAIWDVPLGLAQVASFGLKNLKAGAQQMKVMLVPNKSTRVYLVYTNQKSIIYSVAKDNFYTFYNYPINQKAHLVVLRNNNGQAQLSITQLTTGRQKIEPVFKTMSPEELVAALQELN